MNKATAKAKPTTGGSKKQLRIPPVKVKRVLQSDENIGKMNNAVPIVFASLLEHFTEQLLFKIEQVAARCCLKTLNPMHIKLAAQEDATLHFLLPLFQHVDEEATSDGNRQFKGGVRKKRRKASFVDSDEDVANICR